jgi:hypothetical protein
MVEPEKKKRTYIMPQDIKIEDYVNENPKASGYVMY